MKRMAFIDLTNFKDWPMGGMLEYELAILKELVENYCVDIWGVSVDGVVNSEITLNGDRYPVHIFGNVKTKKKILPNYWRGLEVIRQNKSLFESYDIVYAHTGSCLIAAKMLSGRNTKLVYHQHGLNHRADYSPMSLIQRPGLKLAQKYADLVFVVSDPESVRKYSKEMKKITNARFVAIGSPVDLGRFDVEKIKFRIHSTQKRPTSNFLYTGRLSAFKNVKTVIDAVHIYKEEINENVELVIAGSGDEFEALRHQIKTLNMEKNVRLLGAVSHDEIYMLLDRADVFLTASGGEGVSVSVIEAYAAGLPVVCFDVPGLDRQVIDGITGVIAKEKTSEAFFKAMMRLNEFRTEASYNCLKEARKYESRGIAKKIQTEINELF